MIDSVRACTGHDLAGLLDAALDDSDARHHQERYALQQTGAALYLLAWRGSELAGRCTVLLTSKYAGVRQLLGCFPEINALEARPPGQGAGSRLIASAEATARDRGATVIGLAVEPGNDSARRLYERLGYRDWNHGLLIDEWDETDADGATVRRHRDLCQYLVKTLS